MQRLVAQEMRDWSSAPPGPSTAAGRPTRRLLLAACLLGARPVLATPSPPALPPYPPFTPAAAEPSPPPPGGPRSPPQLPPSAPPPPPPLFASLHLTVISSLADFHDGSQLLASLASALTFPRDRCAGEPLAPRGRPPATAPPHPHPLPPQASPVHAHSEVCLNRCSTSTRQRAPTQGAPPRPPNTPILGEF